MKILLLIFFLHATTAQGVETTSLDCGTANHTMRLNATYVRSFVTPGSIFDGVGIVDPSNRELDPNCKFTEEDGDFVFRANSTTRDDCFVEVQTTEYYTIHTFTVQLFRSPPPNAIVDFAVCDQWVFTCQIQSLYNVSSGAINTFSRSFIFSSNTSNSYNYDISFYNDSSYAYVINQDRVGYQDQNEVYMRVSVDAPDNIVLLLSSCEKKNRATNNTTSLINTNRCPVSPVQVEYGTPPDQEVDVIFNATLDSDDSDFSNEFFDVSCVTELCDSLEGLCDTSCEERRRRRKRSLSAKRLVSVVKTFFRVRRLPSA